jgi:hypothetical protein
VITYGERCPICGDVIVGDFTRKEEVASPDTARWLGWSRIIYVYRHANRRECRAPGAIFER